MTIQITKRQDNNNLAWHNQFIGEKLNAKIEVYDGKEVYMIECEKNKHINFNSTWIECFIPLQYAKEIK